MFFTSPFPENMRKFHHIIMNEESELKSLDASWYLNEKSKEEAISDIYNQIEDRKSKTPDHTVDTLIDVLRKTINDK